MLSHPSRRRFLGTAVTGGAALGLSEFGFLRHLPRVSADEARLDAKLVRLRDDIEPMVRLLEDTPRERVLEEVAARIRGGTSYREILAALLLAGVRNVQPRPSVGFKFHAVLVVNSAHLASLSSPDADRWLPIFWAIDYFKSRQEEERRTSGWRMQPLAESSIPPAHRARDAFCQAMDRWDAEAAEAAAAALARSAGAQEVFELFYRYGARDFRSIGHKAIFVANSWRTLQCIGWQYAEPVLRSLCAALCNHGGDPNPAQSDLPPDRPWRQNAELEKSIRAQWLEGKPSPEATGEMLATLRGGSADEAASQAAALLNGGVSPQSVWDALLVGSGELLMRQPGIIGLHAVTTTNALLYAYQTSGDDATRRLMLLQNAAFLPMFREAAARRGRLGDGTIEQIKPIEPTAASVTAALEEIFADVGPNTARAAARLYGFLKAGGRAEQVVNTARRLVFLKGNDAHDYKFSSAVLEDYQHAGPAWRDLFLALGVFNLPGTTHRDNQLVGRVRQALGG